MLEKLKSLFQDTTAGLQADEVIHPLHLAAAVLLYEVVWADHKVDQDELAVLKAALCQRFGLSPEAADELAEVARKEVERSAGVYPFTRQVCEQTTLAERQELVRELWLVALSDDRLDKYEEHTVRRIADLLYLPQADYIAAKQAAKKQHEQDQQNQG